MSAPSDSPTDSRRPAPRPERGFALLSVIFFVLALTILGLSLFSLSNYEARFFNPALERASAVQIARGGLDWARFVVEESDSLDLVWSPTVVRPDGIDHVVAWREDPNGVQPPDSTGGAFALPIWPIRIRAAASSGGQTHEVEALYEMNPGTELYRRCITAIDFLEIYDGFDATYNVTHPKSGVEIHGKIATPVIRNQAGAILTPAGTWWCRETAPTIRPGADMAGAWWTDRYATAAPLVVPPKMAQMHVYLTPGGTEPAFYWTDEDIPDAGGRRWSVFRDNTAPPGGELPRKLILHVTGTAVWMLPRGIRIEQDVLVVNDTPGTEATLILLTKTGNCPPASCEGIAFEGGFNSPGVNVIMASMGGVVIQFRRDTEDYDQPGLVNYFSLYCEWARLMGPIPDEGNKLQLVHGADCSNPPPQDGPALIDRLIRKNVLPNSRFSRRGLVLKRGTWQETPVALSN